MDYSERFDVTRSYEKAMEMNKWRKEIPEISFPTDWKIRIIPPFAGAVVRFCVTSGNGAHVSVYLDCYESLGIFGEPYWEIYPYFEDVFRCPMKSTDELLGAISRSIDNQLNDDTEVSS